MAKKNNNETNTPDNKGAASFPSSDPKTDAVGIMMRLGVRELWYTTDGQWFTASADAEAHVADTEFEVKHYRKKGF